MDETVRHGEGPSPLVAFARVLTPAPVQRHAPLPHGPRTAAARPAVADDPVATAKARRRAVHAAAKRGDPLQAGYYDKLWAGVLLAADHQPEAAAVVMFTRRPDLRGDRDPPHRGCCS